jgi:hypothetical protein
MFNDGNGIDGYDAINQAHSQREAEFIKLRRATTQGQWALTFVAMVGLVTGMLVYCHCW